MNQKNLLGLSKKLFFAASIVSLIGFSLETSAQEITKFNNKKSGRVIFIKAQNNSSSPIISAAAAMRTSSPTPYPSASASPSQSSSPTPTASPSLSSVSDPLSTSALLITSANLPLAATNFVLERMEKDRLGMTHVRYSQRLRNIRIYGADAISHLNADGSASSLGVNFSDSLQVRSVAKITSTKAVALARKAWRAKFGKKAALPSVADVSKYVLDTSLLYNLPTEKGSRGLVYGVRMLSGVAGQSILYFISADSGKVVKTESLDDGLDRRISDCSYDPGSNLCAAYVDNPNDAYQYIYGRREETAPIGPNPRYLPLVSNDSDRAYDIIGKVHDYVQTAFGMDGANRRGGLGANGTGSQAQPYSYTRVQTYTDYLSDWGMDCKTAQFLPIGAVQFCKGMVEPDVVGHEYAHGIQYFSFWQDGVAVGMVNEGESRALEENHSDVFGEAFEHYLLGSNDWIAGAESTSPTRRNLADPPAGYNHHNFYVPDRLYSPNYSCIEGLNETGYGNMQVLSKAFYLASVGGWFNGCSFGPGIGIEKTIQIWTRALTTYFSRTETFNGAFHKFQQSCADLYGGSDSADCTILRKALESIELDQGGKCSSAPATIPACVDILL